MDLFRQFLRGAGGGGGDEDEDGEDDQLLMYEDYTSSEGEEQSEDEEGDEEATGSEGNAQQSSYDISLPARHLYLGDLDEEGRPSVQEEDTTPIMPLLYIPDRMLFPGETLPMHIYNPHAIAMLRNAFTSRKPVAVCTDLRSAQRQTDVPVRPTVKELAAMGTTADILACREEEEGYWFHGPRFIVKFYGRQRFRLLECQKKLNGMIDCRVQILSDCLRSPRPLHLLSCPAHILASCDATLMESRSSQATIESHMQAERCRRRLKTPPLSQTLCPVPGWVFQLYHIDHMRERVIRERELIAFGESEGPEGVPADLIELSYWVSRRLPVTTSCKLELHSLHCPVQRLQRALDMLSEFTQIFCAQCGTHITEKNFMFSMSVDGPLAAYVNPGGYVHDTLTVTEATNLKKSGRASTDHSWFPGYQWTIMNCHQCREHKGWFFEAVKKNLTPASFFGLRRPGLTLTALSQSSQGGRG